MPFQQHTGTHPQQQPAGVIVTTEPQYHFQVTDTRKHNKNPSASRALLRRGCPPEVRMSSSGSGGSSELPLQSFTPHIGSCKIVESSNNDESDDQDEKNCVIVTITTHNTDFAPELANVEHPCVAAPVCSSRQETDELSPPGSSTAVDSAPLSTPECPIMKSSCSSSTNSQSGKSITSSSSTDGAAAPTPLIVGPPTLSHQLRQLPFRTDLDETQQRHIMKTIVAQHHAQWLSEQQRSKTNSDISGWSKSQQAIVLCHLVAEAHRYQVKLKDQRHVELLPASSLPATPPPPAAANRRRNHAQKELDFSDPKIAALLLADIVMLVSDNDPSCYLDLRKQLVSLNLWL